MDKNEITMSTKEIKPAEKIKAINPVIIVNTAKTDKPYYSIQYYDLADKTWHIGYSSYDLDYVREWLAEYFEPIGADVRPVKYGYWKDSVCSECGSEVCDEPNYCPDCGAEMLFKDDENRSDNI